MRSVRDEGRRRRPRWCRQSDPPRCAPASRPTTSLGSLGVAQPRVALGDLFDHRWQIVVERPARKAGAQPSEVRDVADVIAGAMLRHVAVAQWKPEAGQERDGFEDREAVAPAAADIEHLAISRILVELQKE